jgi:hypothetical protein
MSNAFAQGDDPLIAEVMRKGVSNEPENGFCARTGWPLETSTSDTGNFYGTASPGASKSFQDNYSGPVPYCAYILVEDVSFATGRRCVRAQMWWCQMGRACHNRIYRGCQGPSGGIQWEN